jgi:parallel beta-helix repeat protein
MTLITPSAPPTTTQLTLPSALVGGLPFSDVTAFTTRTGMGLMHTLEALKNYLLTVVVPTSNANFDAINGAWTDQVTTLISAVNNFIEAEDAANAQKIADALAAIANADIIITDPAILAVLNDAQSQTLAWLNNNFAPKSLVGTVATLTYSLLQGPGIDPTGATDSRTGVQAFLDALTPGDLVMVPNGAIIAIAGGITISKTIRFMGVGQLKFSNNASSAAITVTADETFLDGLRIVGVTGPASAPADKQYGIAIQANRVRVIGCVVDGLQQAIAVMPFGEFHDNVISGNVVINVPGSGGGAADATSNAGEDRGDGIVNWGAACTITGNIVTAAPGTDARIGIHTEGLANLHPQGSYAHSDGFVTITGNVVTGKFRRGIACESVYYTNISGNSVADATWWGLSLINVSGCTISNNVVSWTRTNADQQGQAWSPVRCGVMVYGTGNNNIVRGNVIGVESGSALTAGIAVQTDTANAFQDNLLIDGNQILAQPHYQGILLNGAGATIRKAKIKGNKVIGSTNACIYGWSVADVEITDNHLEGVYNTKTALGIQLENDNTSARIDGNSIHFTNTAIHSYGRNGMSTYNNNQIFTANLGFDLYGAAGCSLSLNRISAVTAPAQGLPADIASVGNNF